MRYSFIILIIISLSTVGVEVSGLKVSFNGSQFIPFLHGKSTPNDTNISLRVKTMHPSGILIYYRGLAMKLFLFELIQGRLRLVIDLGNKRHEVLLGYNLANNRWHHVTITHSQDKIILSLDNKESASSLTESPALFDLQNPIYVGGLDNSLEGTLDANYDMPNFIGCLSDVYINSINVLFGATYHTPSNTTTSPLKLSCPKDNGLFEFPSGKSHIMLSSSPLRFSLRLSFRSFTKSGVIAYRAAKNGHVSITLVEGALELKVEVANDSPISIMMGKNLNNGEWHDVDCSVSTHECWLSLDGEGEKRRSLRYVRNIGRFYSNFLIGGEKKTHGFTGCMHNVRVNGHLMTSKSYRVNGAVINRCTLKSFCLPNPCKNGGKCKQQKEGYTCVCGGILYRGHHCEEPFYRATCTEYEDLGLSEDSYCIVDPKSILAKSFVVLCNVTSRNRGVTIITHDKKVSHKVSEGTSQLNGYHYHQIKYRNADIPDIKSLISKTKRCRQYISFHCFNTTILNPPNVLWVSSNGVAQDYWGGAPSGSHKCACAVTSTCVDESKLCNCDVGDAGWREDAGYITDKAALPVSLLQFSPQASQSMYTLGPLECFGFNGATTAKNVTNTTSYLSRACKPIEQRPTSVAPCSTRQIPTARRLGESTKSSSSPQRISSISKMFLESTTKATSITNTLTTELSTLQSESTLLPLVTETNEPAITTELRNDSKKHAQEEASNNYKLSRNDLYLIIIISVVIFLLVLTGVVVCVLRTRGVCGIRCCTGQRSHNDGRVPDKSIGQAIYSGSASESIRPVSMEMGTYNVNSGRWLYQSVNQSGVVKKFVTFEPTEESREK